MPKIIIENYNNKTKNNFTGSNDRVKLHALEYDFNVPDILYLRFRMAIRRIFGSDSDSKKIPFKKKPGFFTDCGFLEF